MRCCKSRSGCCICCNNCTRMLQTFVPMFHLFFRRMLEVCLSGCCICFTYMFQVFYLDVAYVCNDFQVFLRVFQTHVSSVSSFFRRILQVLHLDILKVDQMLHMRCAWEARGGASGPHRCGAQKAGMGRGAECRYASWK
jgi:hypothetical protein